MATRDRSPRYRGRTSELKRLHDAIDEAASGRLTGVIVEGEAGIGKSRLLSEAFELAQGRGYQILSARAEELERASVRRAGRRLRMLGVLIGSAPRSHRSSAGTPGR
jgi:predicted ATP-dependent serine protease